MTERQLTRSELPLFRWSEERGVRAARQLRRRAWFFGFCIGSLAVTVVLPPRPLLVWNASASAPVGLYWVLLSARIDAGDMVIARVPASVRLLAAERHYLPANVPLVKRVAAVPGDTICALGERIFVNGRRIAMRLVYDRAGRLMPWWHGCVRLGSNAYFLLMTDSPASFDGRYFGPTETENIIGKVRLLWAR